MSLQDRATEYAREYGIDPRLYHALIQQESGWDPNARSPVGAAGLTQIMPDTGRDPGFGVTPVDMSSTDDQLRFGAEYLDAMIDRYDGDTSKALAAYNWGAGNADDWNGDMSTLPAETRNYIKTITGGQGSTTAGLLPPAPTPEPVEEEPQYGEGFMGDMLRKRDDWRGAVNAKLGLTDDSAEAIGRVLTSLGGSLS